MSTSVSTTQLNLRIISIVVFTCICYLSIGLPLAVLPGYIHYQLGYSTFVAGIVISLQYISTLVSRPPGRYTDIWGPKSGQPWDRLLPAQWRLHATGGSPCEQRRCWPLPRCWRAGCFGVGESFTATGATLWGIKTVGAIHVTGYLTERRGDLCGDGGRGAAGSYPQSLFLASAALLRW